MSRLEILPALSIFIKKAYGKVSICSAYANLPKVVLEKVAYCLYKKEFFGLDNTDSCWIFDVEKMRAAFYRNNIQEHAAQYEEAVLFEMHVLRVLYTHTNFNGPIGVYKFLLAIDVLKQL